MSLRRLTLLVLAVVLVTLIDSTTGHVAAATPRADPEAAYVVLLRLRWDLYARWKETGQWPADAPANAALTAHSEYWAAARDAGRAILAGGMKGDYWDNAALIIFRAPSEAEANAIVQKDPAVRAHVFQAQVRGFDVHWIGAVAPPKP